jgi:hypothetical protein
LIPNETSAGVGDGLNMNYRWSQTKRAERNG